jgi:uncharacterized integral membrane protein
LLFALASIGSLICVADNSAVNAFPNRNLFIVLILLGFHASIYFFSIFIAIFVFYKVFRLSYWISAIAGLIFGLICVPILLVFLANRKRNEKE